MAQQLVTLAPGELKTVSFLIPNLIPGRLYEAHCSGGITANREDWIQFST